MDMQITASLATMQKVKQAVKELEALDTTTLNVVTELAEKTLRQLKHGKVDSVQYAMLQKRVILIMTMLQEEFEDSYASRVTMVLGCLGTIHDSLSKLSYTSAHEGGE